MTYTVKYRLKGKLFFKTIKKVRADFLLNELECPVRVLILDDETRIEIPYKNTEFVFSKERFIVIKKNMEKESGQSIPVAKD